jgi:hypothetical protein
LPDEKAGARTVLLEAWPRAEGLLEQRALAHAIARYEEE